jgi:hypothetical protein
MEYTISQFRKDIRQPYAWPGGYPRYFIMQDGCALSFKAAYENKRLILEALSGDIRDSWAIAACEINWEDENLSCDHTGETIECAYSSD